LQQLLLGGNQIANIPSSWTNLPNSLQYLSVSSNKITTLPTTWTNLPSGLQRLYLQNNQITDIPTAWTDFPSTLQELYLSQNKLPHISTLDATPYLPTTDIALYNRIPTKNVSNQQNISMTINSHLSGQIVGNSEVVTGVAES
jgi:Leucine-rich repeat (LRR) protein